MAPILLSARRGLLLCPLLRAAGVVAFVGPLQTSQSSEHRCIPAVHSPHQAQDQELLLSKSAINFDADYAFLRVVKIQHAALVLQIQTDSLFAEMQVLRSVEGSFTFLASASY